MVSHISTLCKLLYTLTMLLLHGAILTTMGSPASVTIANLVMEEEKQNTLTTYNFNPPIV